MVIDSAGGIVETNRHAREILHWKENSGLRIGFAEFLVRPDANELDLWFARASAGRLTPLEVRLASGLDVRLTLRKVLGGGRLLMSLEEGSLAQRAESRWKQTEAELRSVLETVHAGVVLVGIDGRIRLTNARFGLLFGLDAHTVTEPQTFDDLARLVGPRFRAGAPYRAPWDSFLSGSGDATHDEFEVTGPPTRVIERYARPILDEQGRRLGWLEAFWDITSQRQNLAMVQQTEKMAAVGQLASGMAHELSNPLTSIMGYAQVLLQRGSLETRGSEAKMIFEEAQRASRIVKNLLSYARQTEPERIRVDVNEVVARTVALRGYELKLHNIVVHCDLEPRLPATLADPHQIQQMVVNLLINAEQAIMGDRRQGHIEVRTRRASESWLLIEISDDGPGIPPEISSRVYDPFFTTKPLGIGTGLGLTVVRSLAEKHEGKVTFENLFGRGTKFTIHLPLVPLPALQPSRVTAVLATEKKIRSAHILVVEDEPTVAQLVADVLREERHTVEAVTDSHEGLLRASHGRYDLIICDLRMPRLDGPAFYDALVRARPSAQHRMLFVTGDTLGPHTVEFLKSHQLEFLTKPFLVEELKSAVGRALELGPAASADLTRLEANK
jgi:signal transduction histidine kinase/CheY-like chemotaxis protein